MIDQAAIRAMNEATLADYVWRRLRLQWLDPPLDSRFRDEPPEDILIRIADEDAGFRRRLEAALEAGLRHLVPRLPDALDEAATREQIASIAFLAEAIEAHTLQARLYALALVLHDALAEGNAPVRDPLFHVLEALGVLRGDPGLEPFWRQIIDGADDAGLRAIAYYGLSKANAPAALAMLERIMTDAEIDHVSVSWHLATETPGPMALGRQAGRFPAALREHVRRSLEEAGADRALLRDFNTGCLETVRREFRSLFDTGRDEPVRRKTPFHWDSTEPDDHDEAA